MTSRSPLFHLCLLMLAACITSVAAAERPKLAVTTDVDFDPAAIPAYESHDRVYAYMGKPGSPVSGFLNALSPRFTIFPTCWDASLEHLARYITRPRSPPKGSRSPTAVAFAIPQDVLAT